MKRDAIEALTNALVGLAVSWCLTMAIFGTTPTFALGVSAVFFTASVARSWALRALFRRLWRSRQAFRPAEQSPCPASPDRA